MEKNIIITILPSFFLKIFDEISDNPKKYKTLAKFKKLIILLTFLSTIIYSRLGSGYCFLLFCHGLLCAYQKQLDHIFYKIGMIILFFGIILNDKSQLKNLIKNSEGLKYMCSTFLFIILEEKLFPEEVSKVKIIGRILIILIGIIIYFTFLKNISDKELRLLITANWFASIFYYLTSIIMKLSKSNPLEDKQNFLEEMIKRVYFLFF